MLTWPRSLAFARGRLGPANPNYIHGHVAIERRRLEYRLHEALKTLRRVAPGVTHPKAVAILLELENGHPRRWTRAMASGRMHLPRAEMSTARKFLAKFNRFLLLLARLGAGRFWVKKPPTNESINESNKDSNQKQKDSAGRIESMADRVQREIAALKRWAATVGEPWNGNGPVIIRE